MGAPDEKSFTATEGVAEYCSNWWNAVKDLPVWSGAILGTAWDELWPEAQNEIYMIYQSARED